MYTASINARALGHISEGNMVHFAENELDVPNLRIPAQFYSGLITTCSFILIRYLEKNARLMRVMIAHAPASVFEQKMIEHFEIISQIYVSTQCKIVWLHNNPLDDSVREEIRKLRDIIPVEPQIIGGASGAIYFAKTQLLIPEGGSLETLKLEF